MFTIKRLLCASALTLGAVALLAMPNAAQAGPKIVVQPKHQHHNHNHNHNHHHHPIVYPVYRPIYPIVYPVAPIVIDRHDYDVLYRGCATDPWQVYGRFDSLRGAEQAAASLQRGGREVTIQTIHNHR
jgi:hypothetical protein